MQLLAEVFDLPARGLALRGVHLGRSYARQSPLGAVDDGRGHFQIAQQVGGGRGGSLRFHLRLSFEKQLWVVEKALAD